MAKTKLQTQAFGGVYDSVRERVYEVEKTALFGIFKWKEIVHTAKIGNTLFLRFDFHAGKETDLKVLVNGIEYIPLTK